MSTGNIGKWTEATWTKMDFLNIKQGFLLIITKERKKRGPLEKKKKNEN